MSSNQQPFPNIAAPLVSLVSGNISQAWLQFFITLWNRTGAALATVVSNVSVVSANGVSGTVENPTSTPAITIILGNIKPASVISLGLIEGSNLSGVNTGDESAGTGLTLTGKTFSVNTSQNIIELSNLTTNGFVKTSAANGTLIIDTSTYITGNQTITLNGDITGSGATAITTTVTKIAGVAVGTPTGTGNVVFSASPTIDQANLVGVTTNSLAATGSVGEIISSNIPIGSPIALTTATPANITSITLTAGDWNVWGEILYTPSVTAVATRYIAAISTTTGAFDPGPNGGAELELNGITFSAGASQILTAGFRTYQVATTLVIYLVAKATYSGAGSTMSAYGFMGARRVR